MIEATFAINNKRQNTVLTDIRAMLLRVVNALLNKTGLPNNPGAFFNIQQYKYEFADDTDIAMLTNSMEVFVKDTVGTDYSVIVEVNKDKRQNDIRKVLYITVTIGDPTTNKMAAAVFRADRSKDGLNLSKVISM